MTQFWLRHCNLVCDYYQMSIEYHISWRMRFNLERMSVFLVKIKLLCSFQNVYLTEISVFSYSAETHDVRLVAHKSWSVAGNILTFAKINNFFTCFSLPDNCNYSKNANVHAAVVALKVFKQWTCVCTEIWRIKLETKSWWAQRRIWCVLSEDTDSGGERRL